jgi:hypothetical protein
MLLVVPHGGVNSLIQSNISTVNTPLLDAGKHTIETDVAPPGMVTVITGDANGPTWLKAFPVI